MQIKLGEAVAFILIGAGCVIVTLVAVEHPLLSVTTIE